MNAYYIDRQAGTHRCHMCGRTGTGDAAYHDLRDGLMQMDCAKCDARLFQVPCHTAEATSQTASDGKRKAFRQREQPTNRVMGACITHPVGAFDRAIIGGDNV